MFWVKGGTEIVKVTKHRLVQCETHDKERDLNPEPVWRARKEAGKSRDLEESAA